MDSGIENKLRKEINYLTRLIEAHKAIKSLHSNEESSTLTTVTTTTGTLKRVRLGSAVPSWSHSGSINSHLPRCKPSSLPYAPSKVSSLTENSQPNILMNDMNVGNDTLGNTKRMHKIIDTATMESCVSDELSDTKTESVDNHPSIIGSKRNVSVRDVGTLPVNRNSKKIKRTDSPQHNGYSWKPNETRKATTPRRKLRNMPDRNKLKWRKTVVCHDGGALTCGNENTMVTSSYRSIPVASMVSRKRRRSNNELSSFIIRRHKMIRVPSVFSPSFSERRLQYLHNHSLHSHSPRVKRRRLSASFTPTHKLKWKSKHKVWKPHKKSESQTNEKSMSETVTISNNSFRNHKSRNMRVVSVMGAQYVMGKSGKSLKKISTNPAVYKSTPVKRKLSSSVSSSSAKRRRASHVVKRSFNRVWCREQVSTKNQYCIFYNRFGHCNRGDKCTFLHDSKRVAICSKFLRGNCDKVDGKCPFSHNLSKEKMPVCSFFLRGLCTRGNCPYLHVNVGQDAELCLDFVRGFCSLGEKCKKQHVLDCPEYSKDGSCPRGKRCPFKHKKMKRQRTDSTIITHDTDSVAVTKAADKSVSSIKEPYPFKKLRHKLKKDTSQLPETPFPNQLITPSQLEFIPLETNEVPEFIAL